MKAPKWPLRRLVEVYWRDSATSGRWQSVDAYRKDRGVGPLRSAGYLLTLDKDVVQIIQSQSAHTEQVADAITIPRENVVKIRRLT